MRMSNEQKIDILLKSFNELKDQFWGNGDNIAEIIRKTFKYDKDTAIDMWAYLLTAYNEHLNEDCSWCFTGTIALRGAIEIGDEAMDTVILNNPIIKNAVFSLASNCAEDCAAPIIRRKIENNDLQSADELLQLVYDNKNRKTSWYGVMKHSMPYRQISDDAYELLEIWCEKVDDQQERAMLSLKMMEYTD